MNEEVFYYLDTWLKKEGYSVTENSLDWVHRILWLVAVLVMAYLIGIICRRIVIPIIAKVVARTRVTWDDYIFNPRVLHTVAHLIPALVVYISLPLVFYHERMWLSVLSKIAAVWLIIISVRFFQAFISSVYELSIQHEELKNRPLKGVYQMLKIVVLFVGLIGIVSVLLGKDPMALFTALGAAATVLMLIFKDTIVGLVAGVQLSANDMVRPGDWIKMPKQGVNGIVSEVNLTTVKVKNWDNTVTTIPPNTLVSDTFENWRVMQESGGRRVARSVFIDQESIRFCTPQELAPYRDAAWFAPLKGEKEVVNLRLFREYFTDYLSHHPRINSELTLMIRQLDPTPQGLPLEFYFFSSDRSWIPYEMLQAEVIETVYADLPRFGLRVFQSPSGHDLAEWSKAGNDIK